MQHHIESLMAAESFMKERLEQQAQNESDGKIHVQMPLFDYVSIIRQVLAEAVSVHVGLYHFVERFCMNERLEQLRMYFHLVEETATFTAAERQRLIDSICYFEQLYEKEDYRLLLSGGYLHQLKFGICYVLQWSEEGVTTNELLAQLKLLKEKFERMFELYHFEQNIRYVLSQLLDVDQVLAIRCEHGQIFYRLTKDSKTYDKIIEKAYEAFTPSLLTEPLQQQLQQCYRAIEA